MRQRYPATGTANARVDLFVADLGTDGRVPLDLGGERDIYLPRVDWFPDSRGIAVQRQSRDQKTLELLRFDAISGRGRVLLTERSDSWVPLHHELTFLLARAAVHLGLVARRLPASLSVRQRRQAGAPADPGRIHGDRRGQPKPAIRAVDERARRVYFTANLPSPLERQLLLGVARQARRSRSA